MRQQPTTACERRRSRITRRPCGGVCALCAWTFLIRGIRCGYRSTQPSSAASGTLSSTRVPIKIPTNSVIRQGASDKPLVPFAGGPADGIAARGSRNITPAPAHQRRVNFNVLNVMAHGVHKRHRCKPGAGVVEAQQMAIPEFNSFASSLTVWPSA